MRNTKYEVKQSGEIRAILEACKVCRLGLHSGDDIYMVPLNFGYKLLDAALPEAGSEAAKSAPEGGASGHGTLTLYFHCAKEGRKLELLRENARVGFELDGGHALIEGERACAYGYRYHSIIGTGTAALLEGAQEKAQALALLMKHQTGQDFSFTPQETASVAVLRVTADTFSAKRHG